MAWVFPALAALVTATATPTATANAAAAPALRSEARSSPATRIAPGASASLTVVARIVRASASIGYGLGPPAPAMVPRRATITAADGRLVDALVYDFE